MFKVPEIDRVLIGPFGSDASYGNNGLFIILGFRIIASDGEGWEHVSVSLPDRCPRWDEMVHIKNAFWDEDDLVVQFHPPKSDYVNIHPNCLHMWRKAGTNEFCERPPKHLIGF